MKANTFTCVHLAAIRPQEAGQYPHETAEAWAEREPPIRLMIVDRDGGGTINQVQGLLPDVMVSRASTGTEALALSHQVNPDVVVADLGLPDMDGALFLTALREIAPAAVVVVLTGHPTMASAIEALRKGAYAYLPKPQSTAVLATAVRSAFRLGQLLKVFSVTRPAEIASTDTPRADPPKKPVGNLELAA